MRIAMIGHKDFPSRSGGVEVVVYELATRLAAEGHDVTVYNRGWKKGPHHYDCEGVHVVLAWTVKKQSLNAFLYSVFATCKMLLHRYDLVHYHAAGPCAMIPIARLFRRRTVATIHGLDWKRAKWGAFASKYLQFGEKMAARYADEVIVLSENDRRYFMERYNRSCVCIPNAITPVTAMPCHLISDRFGLEKNGYLLFLSRIVPEKGLHYLIEAFNRLDTDVKLVIAGEVPDTEYGAAIRSMAADNPNIVFTGFVQGEMLCELYSNCRLFVQPSEVEGLALTLLEALSTGVRCLVSDIPENTSVAPDFTSAFRNADTEDLERALRECLNSDPVNPLFEEQKAYIRKRYTYSTVLKDTLAVYRSVLDRSKYRLTIGRKK